MSVNKRDSALSEVIGMILIIAILVAVMTVYTVYIVPENGKAAEINHMREIRASFLELSYLIDSLVANEKTGETATIPIRLRSDPAPGMIPLFTPQSSSSSLVIEPNAGTFTIEIDGLTKRIASFPDDVVVPGALNPTMLKGSPDSLLFKFDPTFFSSVSIGSTHGLGEDLDWRVDLGIRDVLVSGDIDPGTGAFIPVYNQSLVAVSNGLEYVVISEIRSPPPVTVNLKLMFDLFGIVLGEGSGILLSADPSGSTLTVSYGASVAAPLVEKDIESMSVLTGLTFESRNYYWVNQQYLYQKGGVFLRQEGESRNSTSLANAPIRVTKTPDGHVEVVITDIDVRGSGGSSRISGGNAQVIASVSNITNQICYEVGSDYCHNAADVSAKEVRLVISGGDDLTLSMWEDMLEHVCSNVSECCTRLSAGPACCSEDVCLLVRAPPSDRLSVKYTKVNVDLEIRP